MNTDVLQKLARSYLSRIRNKAITAPFTDAVDKLITDNKKGSCVATKEQVDVLSRIVDDNNIKLHDISKEIDISYRYLEENDIIKKNIRKFKDKGHYSKVDVMILKDKLKNK